LALLLLLPLLLGLLALLLLLLGLLALLLDLALTWLRLAGLSTNGRRGRCWQRLARGSRQRLSYRQLTRLSARGRRG
jgi:hypothetical protein